MHSCDLCDKVYQSAQAFYKHQRNKHNIIRREKTQVQCFLCKSEFSSKDYLKKHIRTVHKASESKKRRLKCPLKGCRTEFVKYSHLRSHLNNDHSCPIQEDIYEFETMQAFNEWKVKVEENQNCTFVCDYGEKHLANNIRRSHYFCHRSYYPRKTDNLKRSSKNCGTNKISGACPAAMVLTTDCTNKLKVIFYSTHAGHECVVGRLRISQTDRSKIAGKLSEGVPIQRVLHDIRNSVVEGAQNDIKRVHLVERKDLHNIKRDYNINYSTKLHENDAVSVRLWVQQMNEANVQSPILYFKEQGQQHNEYGEMDFILIIMTEFQLEKLVEFGKEKICIDGTHGLNNYGFQLYTILVIDNHGSGIPVAFCFSNREDTTLFKLYFECIKERVGTTISPNVFMSDDAPVFYNAWSSVMGPVENQLLCTWHVQRNWFKNLNKISGTNFKDKRSLVFKTLKVLQCEPVKEEFHSGFTKFINELMSDPDTNPFGDYIIKTYSGRVAKWAYSYRPYLGINTNMHLEALHKKIKYSYLDGKQCRRLDKTLDALFNLLRDAHFETVIKISKNKLTSKCIKIRESHKMSLGIDNSQISVLDENKWNVSSSRDPTIKYLVEKTEGRCIHNCSLKCMPCSICVHIYKCSCVDNIIRFNICKHIHAVVGQSGSSNENMVDTEDYASLNLPQPLPSFAEKNDIASRCELILGLNSRVNLSDDSRNYVIKYLDKVIDKLNEGDLQFAKSQSKLNINKYIEPQVRFYPKKSKKRVIIPVPSEVETNIIRNSFHEEQSDILHIHTGFDHTYHT